MPDVSILWVDVVALAPELTGVLTTTAEDEILLYVNDSVKTATWGEPKDRLAAIYLAAHMGASLPVAAVSGTGPIASEKVGGVSYTYAISTAMEGLDDTSYGRRYKEIRKTVAKRTMFALTT